MAQGLFITFEGGEGGGKTTQINRLATALGDTGRKVITTREPGGTAEGDKIRDLLVRRDGGNWTPQAEVLMLYAARLMNWQHVIAPALAKGKIVICDRFSDSTLAYQGYGHGLDMQWIKTLHTHVMGDIAPDLTFILDIDPAKGLARTVEREALKSRDSEYAEDRYERLDIAFHNRLRHGFLEIAKSNPARCSVIDAQASVHDVAQKIRDVVTARLSTGG